MSAPGARATVPFAAEIANRAPAALGSAAGRISARLQDALAAETPPGATLIVADSAGVLLRIFGGWACVVGERLPTTAETRYDLASLTKVIATVPLSLAFAERGLWTLDDPLVRGLPGFPRTDTTLRALLTHTSGLPAHGEFYRLPGGREAIRRAVYDEAESLSGDPGPVCHSDLGYMLLGAVVLLLGGIHPVRRLELTQALRQDVHRELASALT